MTCSRSHPLCLRADVAMREPRCGPRWDLASMLCCWGAMARGYANGRLQYKEEVGTHGAVPLLAFHARVTDYTKPSLTARSKLPRSSLPPRMVKDLTDGL